MNKFFALYKNGMMRQLLSGLAVFALLLLAGAAYADTTPTATTGATLATMMTNLSKNLSKLVYLFVAASYVTGLWFITSAINELRVYGQARTMVALQTSFTGPAIRLFVGILMMFFPGFINIAIYSFWTQSASSASYLRFGSANAGVWDVVMDAIRVLVQVFGYVSIFRGFVQLSRAGKQGMQPGIVGKGIMHIVGGILAVNIVGTVRVIQLTLGLA